MSTEDRRPSKGGFGSKLKGLFVEGASEANVPTSAADEIATIAGGVEAKKEFVSAMESVNSSAISKATSGAFDNVFQTAGITEAEMESVKKAEALLKTLPDSLPLETKKQILTATLRTFGVDAMTISQTLSKQKRALEAYIKVAQEDLKKREVEDQTRTAALKAELEKITAGAARRLAGQDRLFQDAATKISYVETLSKFLFTSNTEKTK